jgi:cytochrome c2
MIFISFFNLPYLYDYTHKNPLFRVVILRINLKNSNMKKWIIVAGIATFLFACGGNEAAKNDTAKTDESTTTNAPATADTDKAAADAKRGIGKFTKVEVGATLDAAMADAGNKVYDVKCGSCHKLTEERLVGPGWKGVTTRRTPEWVMNFATNVDEMLAKDPEAQAQLEICLVRMPNQNLTDDDARHVYEFMRKNDGVK